MTIRTFYRTHPGSNQKSRPPWFSRDTCLMSLQRSLTASAPAAPITFVADGGMPAELERLPGADDRIEVIRGGTAAASLRLTMKLAARQARRHPDDLFWVCEDDYLYAPEAMRHLQAAADALPDVDYFTLFVPRPSEWSSSHPSQPDREFPPLPGGTRTVGNLQWRRIACTTSTFAVRGHALVRDAGLIRLGTRPGAPFDGATWHLLQGAQPYSWRHLFHDIDPYLSHRGLAKIIGKPIMRVTLNVVTRRTARAPRTLVAPDRNQAVHVETPEVAGLWQWQQLAEELQRTVRSA